MKLDPHILRFPSHLPNDLEGYIFFYPTKFPKIIQEYEKAVKRSAANPDEFVKLGNFHRKELFAGFEKINNDFQKGDKDDLSFLVDIDQRLHRLICFRFWIVNYLFPDGPVHEFYTEKIHYFSRKLVDIANLDIEDYEAKVSQVQRDLMQGDYADLYLQNALNCVEIIKTLKDYKKESIIKKALNLLKQGKKANKEIYKLFDSVIKQAYDKKNSFGKKMAKHLEIMINQAKMRKTRLPIYNVLIHAIEFEDENNELKKRHNALTKEVNNLLALGRQKFSKKEAEELEISYKMANNFTRYKDLMGDIDSVLLPMWFELLYKAHELLQKSSNEYYSVYPGKNQIGPGGMFYSLSWYLPDDLKIKVHTPDLREFSLKNL